MNLIRGVQNALPNEVPRAVMRKRITGADLDTAHRWQVAGTDLGIPYVLENGAIGFLFGDTFSTARPEENRDWRSPVMLRSHSQPATQSIIWDNAAGVGGDGLAPAIMEKEGGEFTVIPNDGISFSETGRQIISFMSIEQWYKDPNRPGPNGSGWKTRYAGLAYSDDGNTFIRTGLKWWNNDDNSDPYQMWTMQRDGDWVYIFSVRAGRQWGPMMLRRVRWDRMFAPREYECWGHRDGQWQWGNPCTPILEGHFGEPSVRRLRDGAWVMAYFNKAKGAIVTRTASGPDRVWTDEKIQVSHFQQPWLYGGFIHPWSSTKPFDLHLMVSVWKQDGPGGSTTEYHVSHYMGNA